MHVTLRCKPNFILKEEIIREEIWLSASLGGRVSAPLTSTGMRLVQTCTCFCFENLQEKNFHDCSKDLIRACNELTKVAVLA